MSSSLPEIYLLSGPLLRQGLGRFSLRRYLGGRPSSHLSLRNEEITQKFAQVILVDERGVRQPNPASPATILSSMDRRRYDLILVNAEHVPPLVRLRPRSAVYERERAQEMAAALQRLRAREKEVRFNVAMASADRERRMGKVKELLADAYRVRLLVEGSSGGGTGGVQARERLGHGLLSIFRDAYGKDLNLVCPPETAIGHWAVTIQSASAEPALLRRRRQQGQEDEETVDEKK